MLNLFSVVIFHRSMVNCRRGVLVYVHSAITSLVKSYSIHLWSIGESGGTSALSICAFGYMLNIFRVVIFHRSMVNWRRGALVYVHSAICETYVVLWYSIHLWSIGGGTSALSICAFCYLLNLFSVVVFYRSMVNWRRGALVYVHSAICETYVVLWYSIHLWSIGGEYICPKYMCILLFVKLIQCSGML